MADEAVIVELLGDRGDVVRYACNNSDAIAKGQLLVADTVVERKVSGAALTGVPAAGIASEEKKAADGQLSIGVYTNCIADLVIGTGAVATGQYVVISGQNHVNGGTVAEILSGMALGKLMGPAATNGVVTVRVKC